MSIEAARALLAKPFVGGCHIHWATAWYADSEEEIQRLLDEHMAAEHPNWGPPVYWAPNTYAERHDDGTVQQQTG